jgi:hypothetical protein
MPPTTGYDPIGTVQEAIMSLLQTQMPQFLGIGNRMFVSFATILIVWHGIRMMLAWRESGEHMFSFAKLLLLISFGYAMIAFYASPRRSFDRHGWTVCSNHHLNPRNSA